MLDQILREEAQQFLDPRFSHFLTVITDWSVSDMDLKKSDMEICNHSMDTEQSMYGAPRAKAPNRNSLDT